MAAEPAKPGRFGLLKKILLGFVAVLAAFAGVVALQPADFAVTRTATINAPAAVIFAQVNDFRKWEAWSPWEKLDPAMKKTYSGPSAGPGAVYSWVGDDKVGEGRMTLTDSKPAESVKIKLDFIKPFEDTCATEFAFKASGAGTGVTWTMAGHKIGRASCRERV